MLYDPVKAVHMEAARRMTEISDPPLDSNQKKVFQISLDEYQKSMEYSADFAFGRYNLANLYAALKQPQKAVENYRAAIKIDNLFYPAKVNLAMLYNQMGKNNEAGSCFVKWQPPIPKCMRCNIHWDCCWRKKNKYAEAAKYLELAARGMPERARIHYNLGLLRQHLKQDSDAEASLLKAQELEPDNLDYLYALADFYLKRRKLQKARSIAEEMIARHPTQRIGHDILNLIEKNLN